MSKRLFGPVIALLTLIALMFIVSLAWDEHLHTEEDLRRPNDFGSYQGYGYYKIDPETILVSLKKGDVNVFQPLLKEPSEIWDEIPDISISWTQEDFMSIYSALGKLVWNDSMESQEWSIYDVDFSGGCIDGVCEYFDSSQIVFFKKVENSYVTRIMDIQPYFGLVRWGDVANYPEPILRKWKGAEFRTSPITAEDALRIAEKDGAPDLRLRQPNPNTYAVYLHSSRFHHNSWAISYHFGLPPYAFHVSIDLETGESEFLNTNQ